MQTGPCPRASRTRHSAFRCSHVGFYQKSTAPAAGRGRCLAQRRPAGRRGGPLVDSGVSLPRSQHICRGPTGSGAGRTATHAVAPKAVQTEPSMLGLWAASCYQLAATVRANNRSWCVCWLVKCSRLSQRVRAALATGRPIMDFDRHAQTIFRLGPSRIGSVGFRTDK